MSLYFDNNATTQPLPEVVEAMRQMLDEHWHNPSAVYRSGQAARQRVDLARKDVAALIGARPRSITFTGSGTEAIDLAVRGYLTARRRAGHAPGVIITTPIEHSALRGLVDELGAHHGAQIKHVEMDAEGVVKSGSLERLLNEHADVELVSIQWANNETGAVHPVRAIGELCRARGVAFHCDATQWVGKMPTRVGDDSVLVDFLTFSPHKFHGPKGVGVVYTRAGLGFAPLIHGEQELGRRGGTENTAGIVGAGVACRLAAEWLADPANIARGAALRDRFERGVLEAVPLPRAVVNGPNTSDTGRRLWNTTNIAFPRLEAEALLLLLSEHLPSVCCSAGAACSSGALEPSPVLRAMGIAPETAHGALRFSLSRLTTVDEVDAGIAAVKACVERLRSSMV